VHILAATHVIVIEAGLTSFGWHRNLKVCLPLMMCIVDIGIGSGEIEIPVWILALGTRFTKELKVHHYFFCCQMWHSSCIWAEAQHNFFSGSWFLSFLISLFSATKEYWILLRCTIHLITSMKLTEEIN
jgi:hypothetical protein